MYDFVSMVCYSADLVHSLFNNKLLDFETLAQRRTWSLKNDWYTANYKNLTFRVHEESHRVEIAGSLHKYFEGGKTNWREFTHSDALQAIDELAGKFGFLPIQMNVHNLEFGINLQLPFDPDNYLNRLLAYKNQPFEAQYIKSKTKGKFKIAGFSQYEIKAYNKSAQYIGAYIPTLRLEKRVNRMQCIGWPDVTLETLRDIDFADHCFNDLLKLPQLFVIGEQLNFDDMTKRERKTYQAGTNMMNWKALSGTQRQRLRERLHKLIDRLRPDNERLVVDQLLAAKHDNWKAYIKQPKSDTILSLG